MYIKSLLCLKQIMFLGQNPNSLKVATRALQILLSRFIHWNLLSSQRSSRTSIPATLNVFQLLEFAPAFLFLGRSGDCASASFKALPSSHESLSFCRLSDWRRLSLGKRSDPSIPLSPREGLEGLWYQGLE